MYMSFFYIDVHQFCNKKLKLFILVNLIYLQAETYFRISYLFSRETIIKKFNYVWNIIFCFCIKLHNTQIIFKPN